MRETITIKEFLMYETPMNEQFSKNISEKRLNKKVRQCQEMVHKKKKDN